MKKMGAVGLLVFLLVISICISAFIGSSTSGANLIDYRVDESRSEITSQYGPNTVFQNGVVFDDLSYVIQLDPWVKDFTSGDFNDDGLEDLAVISNNTNFISIYNRTADGYVDSTPWRISKPGVVDMRDIVAGDLNKTGKDDIVVSYNDSSGSAHVCIFHQSHGFSSSEAKIKDLSGTEPFEVTIGRFNNNSDNSIAVVCRGNPSYGFDDYVDVWKYPFGTPAVDRRSHQIATSPQFFKSRFIDSGDIDGDGKDDIAIGNESGPNVCIMLQPATWGAGSWTTSTKLISGQASDIELTDVMGLGYNDLVFANTANSGGSSRVYIYRNTGTGLEVNPQQPIETFLGLGSIALGEFSGGPGVDLIVLSRTSNNASAYFRDSPSSWYGSEPNITFPTGIAPISAVVDRSLTGAECVFVLSQGMTNGPSSLESFAARTVLSGNANSNLFAPSTDPTMIATGRLANGNVVVATTLSSTDQLLIHEVNTTITRILPTQSGPVDVAFGRFDSDSSDDIAVMNSDSHTVSIYPGSQLFSSSQPSMNVTIPNLDPSSLAVGSLRGTGLDDIIVGYDGGVFILYNTGDSQLFRSDLNESLGIGVGGPRTMISIGDLDSDNDAGDIAALNSGADSVEMYLRNTGGSVGAFFSDFSQANLTNVGSQFGAMTIIDCGGTDYPDVAVADDTHNVFLYPQPTYGFTLDQPAPSETIDTGHEVARMAQGDLNDDGIEDLLIAYADLPGVAGYFRYDDMMFRNGFNGTTGGPAGDVSASDIDGDARVDVICASPYSHSLSLWFQRNLVPLANATASRYVENEGVGILFDGSRSNDSHSDRSSLSYYWTFNSTDHSTEVSVTHIFWTQDSYNVSLRVTDRGGLINYSNVTITINDAAPTASFTPPSSPVEGVQVTFTDTSTSYPDQIVGWTWEFGDESEAHTKDATHTYMEDGDFIVNLTVVDDDGSTDKAWTIVTVADASPRADFVVSNLSPLENKTVYFNSTSYSYPDEIAKYEWDFGDGSSTTGPTQSQVSHVYSQNGTYNVTLTITDSDGSESTFWRFVQVLDSVPTTSFVFSPTSPLEGQDVLFTDMSSAYDGLVSWEWDFGDGNTSNSRNPTHFYEDNGSYEVTLTTYDADDSFSQKRITLLVRDTSPTVLSLTTQSGLTSFGEDETITFIVTASPAWEPIKKYAWNFSYSSGFVVDVTTLVNHVTHSFPQSGSYMVVVRVWDSDSYDDKNLWIDVVNVPPTADFQNETPVNGYVTFYASYSTDTPHDVPLLNYRWNFDDGSGWGGWSSSTIINHTFSETREYDITLEVRDDDGAIARITKELIISGPDDLNPSISDVVTPQNAVVGKPITVFANVTDNSGYVEAYLRYRIGNETEETRMILVSGTTYQGQIPSQNSTVRITCWIEARDYNGNNYTVGPFEIVVQEIVPAEYWAAGFGGAAFLLVGMFLGFRRYRASVDEAFIIYEDGRLIAHHTRHLKPGMDDEVLSSMLIAIQDFVKDSFKDEKATALKRLDFGEKKILVEKGERVYLAAVLHGKHAGKIPQKMLQVVEEIQKDFGPTFAQWDGDLESVRGVKDEAQVLFKKQWSISRIIPIWKPIEEKGPLMTECPVCDQQIPADSKKCPSCSADFGSASVADLERVAQDLLREKDGTQSVADETADHRTKDDGPQE